MTDMLRPNELLFVNQMLTSLSGEYILTLQLDSNLVLYGKVAQEDRSASLEPIWATDTLDRDAWYAMMRADGNFVLCDQEGETVWESGTDKEDSFLRVLDEGKIVISETTPVWEAGIEDDADEEVHTLDEEGEENDLDAVADDSLATTAAGELSQN